MKLADYGKQLQERIKAKQPLLEQQKALRQQLNALQEITSGHDEVTFQSHVYVGNYRLFLDVNVIWNNDTDQPWAHIDTHSLQRRSDTGKYVFCYSNEEKLRDMTPEELAGFQEVFNKLDAWEAGEIDWPFEILTNNEDNNDAR